MEMLGVFWLIGFAAGYAVRAYISRRRRAERRKKFYEKRPEYGNHRD